VIKVSPDLSMVLDLFYSIELVGFRPEDNDFGSGGVLVLPDQPGSYPHLAVAAEGRSMFLMNEDRLGGYSSQTNNVLDTHSIRWLLVWAILFCGSDDSVARGSE